MPFEQLALPLAGLIPQPEPTRIPRTRRVFVNRNLQDGRHRLGRVRHGLHAGHLQPARDGRALDPRDGREARRARLPASSCATIPYSIDFPIRGLLIDKRFGHILKMDRYKVVHEGLPRPPRAREGGAPRALPRRRRSARPRRATTGSTRSTRSARRRSTRRSSTRSSSTGSRVDYAQALHRHPRVHRRGAPRRHDPRRRSTADLPRFVDRDRDARARRSTSCAAPGKKLFLLTNSRWPYTEQDDDVPARRRDDRVPDAGGTTSTSSSSPRTKPAFFQEQRPLMRARRRRRSRPARAPARARQRSTRAATSHDLERALGVTGDEVLYVGDHIYGDILRSQEGERLAHGDDHPGARGRGRSPTSPAARTSTRAESSRSGASELEDELRFYQARFKDLVAPHRARARASRTAPSVAEARGRARRASSARSTRPRRALRARRRRAPRHRAARSTSASTPTGARCSRRRTRRRASATQVEEYACLYTSRVSNFLAYSPQQYFRSPRDLLPHEL